MEYAEPKFAFPNPSSLVEAILRAKATLPRFRKALKEGRRKGVFYGVKLHFPQLSGDEGSHIWLSVNELFADLYFCSPIELPADFVGMKIGESKLATDDDVEDWMILANGTLYGGFSLRAIRQQMSLSEQVEYDSYMGVTSYSNEDAALPGDAADSPRENGFSSYNVKPA